VSGRKRASCELLFDLERQPQRLRKALAMGVATTVRQSCREYTDRLDPWREYRFGKNCSRKDKKLNKALVALDQAIDGKERERE
jgi:hypothetical protein